jgi:hypothetical protein
MSFAAIVAIDDDDDDDAPGWSLLPLLLPLLLRALPVVVVLLKLAALRVLLALALLGERRSRFKSVRLILFSCGGSPFFSFFLFLICDFQKLIDRQRDFSTTERSTPFAFPLISY